ncbi:hypothetical protein FS837_007882 [Tulasnella sp. UAMH 9824]|nr:hypothetical protein FS837_007882 [Tulasnella sp. UAMH 9824]
MVYYAPVLKTSSTLLKEGAMNSYLILCEDWHPRAIYNMVTVLWNPLRLGRRKKRPKIPARTAFGIEQYHHPSNTDISSSSLSNSTLDRHTMEGVTESTLHSQSDDEIETYEDSDAETETEEDPEEIELKSYITNDMHIVPEIVHGIHSADREVRLMATVKLRRLMQKLTEVASQSVINSGLLEPVVEMLSTDDLELCKEASWILTGVGSGTSEQTTAVVAAGAIPKLVALFPCGSTEVLEGGLLNLGSIGADSYPLRDLVVQGGGVTPVLDILGAPERYESKVADSAAWALRCLLNSGRDQQLGYEVTRHMIPVLIKFILNTTDETLESFTEVLTSLGRISFDEAVADAIIATGITPRLVELCAAKHDNLRYHAVKCMEEIIVGGEASAEAAIQAGFLTALKSCINCEHVNTRRAAYWAASTIAAGQGEDTKTRYDAVCVLLNLTDKGREHNELLVKLARVNCMEAISVGLSSLHHATLGKLIRALENMTDTKWSGK